MKERIEEVMRMKGLNSTQFANMVNIKQAALSHVLNGRNKPSLDVVMKICQAYPDINVRWMLYGEGEMQVSGAAPAVSTDTSAEQTPVVDRSEAPTLFDFDADTPRPTPADVVQQVVKEEIRYIERPPRKIIEVRIFFDDGTYETLMPSK